MFTVSFRGGHLLAPMMFMVSSRGGNSLAEFQHVSGDFSREERNLVFSMRLVSRRGDIFLLPIHVYDELARRHSCFQVRGGELASRKCSCFHHMYGELARRHILASSICMVSWRVGSVLASIICMVSWLGDIFLLPAYVW